MESLSITFSAPRPASSGQYRQHPEMAKLVRRSLPRTEQANDHEFRRQIRQLHRLGPRVMAEHWLELFDRSPEKAWMSERLRQYSLIDPQLIDCLNASDWPTTAELVSIDGGNKGRAA